MAFVQKYEKGKTLINELKDSAKEYVVENVNEATNPLESTSENVPDKVNTSDTPIIKATVNTKAGDKITINGVDINKKLLIGNLKKKSFSATGLNRVAWDKILGKLENLSEYNSSNTLDIDYGSDLKYDVKDLETRGNLILSEILKEASSNKYSYEKPEPFTFTKFLGSELGLGKDYDYVNDYEILKSFEEDQYEPEYSKNKKTGLEEIVKNKYTTNLSTLKRSELISKYLDKEIDNVNNSSEDTKYLYNTIDKTEYLNRLNEAKIALDQLKRTKTIKNAAPEFYRIGIDVNKLFNAQQQNNNTPSKETTNADGSKTTSTTNTDGSRTDITRYPDGSQITKKYDKNGNEVKEDNTKKEEVKKEEIKKETTPVTNSKIFSTKPQGLPEHMLKSDYRSYIINSVKNPFIPGSTQWVNWFDNPFSNPYDSETQPKEYAEWDKSVKGMSLEYSFVRPEGLKESIPSLEEIRKIDPTIKDWGDYIFKAKENPFEANFWSNESSKLNKDNWNKWKEKFIYFNPYEINEWTHTKNNNSVKISENPISRDLWNKKYNLYDKDIYRSNSNNSMYTNTNEEIFKAATKNELDKYWAEYSKSNPRKGHLGLKFQPYSILDSNYEKYNKLINDVNSGKFTNYYKNQQLNQNKGKINLLDNFMFPINTDKVTNNNSIIENKNSIKHIPEEEGTKETSEHKTLIGPSTITGIGDVLSNLAAWKINKNIADNYINALQAPIITSTQYITPKVYQDPSNSNYFAALRNSIPKTADINDYQNSLRNFYKQIGEYLFKKQTQQAAGIRQDKEKLNAIQNKQLEEDTKVTNANIAALNTLKYQKASIRANEAAKKGEISLDLLNKISNFVAGYKNEDLTLTRPIDEASYRSKLDAITSKKQIIENDPNKKSEDKLRELGDLAKEEQNIHEEYMKLLKNKYNSYFSRWDEKTTTPKTDVFK